MEFRSKKIYGVFYDKTNSSSFLKRIDDAKDFGTEEYPVNWGNDSDKLWADNVFDKIEPFTNHFKTDAAGNKMRVIKRCYFQEIDGPKYRVTRISMTKHDDSWFTPPCFIDQETGRELDYVEVGVSLADYSDDNTKMISKFGRKAKAWISRTDARNKAKANNVQGGIQGYQQLDIHILYLLQTMFMIEFATRNGQGTTLNPGMQGEVNLVLPNARPAVNEANVNRVVVPNNATNLKMATLGASIYMGTTSSGKELFECRQILSVDNVGVLTEGETTSVIAGNTHLAITFDGDPVSILTTQYVNNHAHKSGFVKQLLASSGHIGLNDGLTPMVYRGIESFWGGLWQWVDGINFNNLETWIANNAAQYTDNVFVPPYVKVGYQRSGTNGQNIKSLGYDEANPTVQMPTDTTGGTDYSQEWGDVYNVNPSGVFALLSGGFCNFGLSAGPRAAITNSSASATSYYIGARLCRKAL